MNTMRLLAGLEMCDLPDQFLDLGAGGLGVDPGEPGLMQLDCQGFQVDHGSSLRPRLPSENGQAL